MSFEKLSRDGARIQSKGLPSRNPAQARSCRKTVSDSSDSEGAASVDSSKRWALTTSDQPLRPIGIIFQLHTKAKRPETDTKLSERRPGRQRGATRKNRSILPYRCILSSLMQPDSLKTPAVRSDRQFGLFKYRHRARTSR